MNRKLPPTFPLLDYGKLHDLHGHLLRHASLRAQVAFQETFDSRSITPLQFMIFELLRANGPTSHGDVGLAMGTSASVITGTIRPMVERGLLRAIQGNADRRKVSYELTELGQIWFDEIRGLIPESETRLTERLTHDERHEFGRLLRKLLGSPSRRE